MRKNIVIISQNTHSFLRNEIRYAADIFQRVVVICPYDSKFKEVVSKIPNVEMLFYNKKELYLNGMFSIYRMFEKEKRIELVDGIKSKKLSAGYIKFYIFYLALARLFEKCLANNLKLTINDSQEWVFYSAWYDGTAFAVTEAKKKYKYAKAVSLAHSFEVDEIKNKFTKVLFRKNYHSRLDIVSFISKNVYNSYKKEIAKKLNLSLENTEVRYLGAKKLGQDKNKPSSDGVFRILSCSHVVPVKRIDLIFKTLDAVNVELPIEWTHIGDGKEMENIKRLVSKKKNKNLNINLLGAIENTRIHDFYSANPIDLFVNLSASEGIPVSIMEAISYGIPVLATDVGGNSEIVRKEFGTIVATKPTISETNAAILEFINLSTHEKEDMRKYAMEFFENYFNAETLRKDFFKMLNENVNEVI
ncbi:glycosyltransferase [Fredinandcohnia sp. 179-A 10B2 NHS]|uniref:glycosyltransferase n=1 Tax=Fredinandcohnia sp. 179-A 10B2 NHS TaxID=3235176 RepID=UPI0039A2580F